MNNVIGNASLTLQAVADILYGVSSYYIWRQLSGAAIGAQARMSERLASQSIALLKYIADDPLLYDYFYRNKPLADEGREGSKVCCCAEMMANFLEHVVLQKQSLPRESREAWMCYVREHYNNSRVVRDFVNEHKDCYADVFLRHVAIGEKIVCR